MLDHDQIPKPVVRSNPHVRLGIHLFKRRLVKRGRKEKKVERPAPKAFGVKVERTR
jgi:hypothetical protein